jgi:hypothetical protein
MSWVNLEPLYTEPDMKYHLLSGCLFFKEKYTKTSNGNGKVKDVSLMKQQMMTKCIEQHAKDYEQGIWDKNVRLRIYFDKSVHKSPLLNACFEKYLHHPFFQWVRYDIPERSSINPSFHKGFIGTIVRFHPLFIRSSNVVAVSIVDLDNKYTSKWKEMIHKFIKSDYDIHYISGIFHMPFYSNIIKGITKEDDPSILWSGAGLFSSKVVFPRSRWTNMLTHIQSNSILGRIRFIDSFRVALYNTSEMFMEEFEYGLDEVLLNDMIYYYIERNLVKPMVTKVNPMYLYVNYYQKMILDYLKWNDGKSEQMYFLYKALHVSSYEEMADKVNSFKTLEQLFRYFKKKEVSEILWHLQFNRRLLYLIQEYNTEKVRKTPHIYEYLVG